MEVLGGAFARDDDSTEFGGFSTVELRAEGVCSSPLGRPALPLRGFHPAKGTMPTEPRHISTDHLGGGKQQASAPQATPTHRLLPLRVWHSVRTEFDRSPATE
jgi:hypothetical protein